MAARKAVRGKPKKVRASASQPLQLVLYISGATENSQRALLNIQILGQKHLRGRYRLSVVDLFQEPLRARKHAVVALPTLVKTLPLPVRRLVGGLADEMRVLIGLELVPESPT